MQEQEIEIPKQLKSYIIEILTDHRMLTLQTVEAIVRWRETLAKILLVQNNVEIKKPKFNYYNKGKNYLIKIKKDGR